MGLPVIDDSVDIPTATKNISKYLENLEGVDRIFKIEQLRAYIKTLSIARKAYLLYTLKCIINKD